MESTTLLLACPRIAHPEASLPYVTFARILCLSIGITGPIGKPEVNWVIYSHNPELKIGFDNYKQGRQAGQ